MTAPGSVSPQQLRSMLSDKAEFALLDVREAGQFGESHLLFATPAPYSTLERDVSRLVPRKSTRIVLCDDGGSGVAALAARRLRDAGFTGVALLAGGTAGWAQSGYALFKGVNVPSKLFGELVEHAFHTPRVTVQELARMRAAGENFVVVDGRPYAEYSKMSIPGGICCPNAELPYRIREIVKDPTAKIIVNCAGRTRSILGAQTLINFGVPNPVFALENGTQGWVLADFKLEHGATRRYPEQVDAAALPDLQARARTLMERYAVRSVAARDVASWLRDPHRTTVLLDVRTAEEFDAGSIPGAAHAPGGQLVQATDQWVAVRNARIVLIDGEAVRAPVAASWLKQLGLDAYVLEDGMRSGLEVEPLIAPALPPVPAMTAGDAKRAFDAKSCAVFDLGPSMSFRRAHIPGSRWTIRPRIASDAKNAPALPVVLVADDADIVRMAALDLRETGVVDIHLLHGGLAAWTRAGYPAEASPGTPPDNECIDYLFFVHDRHAGNRVAMKEYLTWETGLLAQLDDQDKAAYNVGPAH